MIQEAQGKLCNPTPQCDKSCVTLPDEFSGPIKHVCPCLGPLAPCLKMVLFGEEEKLRVPFLRPHSWRQSFCREGGTRSLLPSVFLMHEVTLIQKVVQVHGSPPTSSCLCRCSDARVPSPHPVNHSLQAGFQRQKLPTSTMAALCFPPMLGSKGLR